MTTNILVNEDGTEPIRTENEFFILKKNDISYRILLDSKKQYNGEGYIILTSERLIIFPTQRNSPFKSIEIPLNKIYQETFKQPLFGKNYLTAKCNPIFASQFGSFTFTIWLKGNRMGTIVGAFYTLLDSLRNNQGRNHDENVIRALQNNNFNELFAIDPEDNSFIYQIQPPPANIPKENYKSIINNGHPPAINNFRLIRQNANFNNYSQINEEQNKRNNDLYLSTFIYKNPKKNSFGFDYENSYNKNNHNFKTVNLKDSNLINPYLSKENNNKICNNINDIFNNDIKNNNYINNPYIQERNNSLSDQFEIIDNNNFQNINIETPLNKKYQNIREDRNNENILNNDKYSINNINNYQIIDNNKINLNNYKFDDNLLKKITSDDLIPDSKVVNPYI